MNKENRPKADFLLMALEAKAYSYHQIIVVKVKMIINPTKAPEKINILGAS
jgi:hypothetical protein